VSLILRWISVQWLHTANDKGVTIHASTGHLIHRRINDTGY